ncbi:MAG: helix-turn-helix transcriptional regulator [Actinobacteria bacterium]|nr:helix-turn-helix transcriptional regulator [Actinomycetota bacterium]
MSARSGSTTPSVPASSPSPNRRRDADATRRAQLDAAGALFDEKGFDNSTTREIGARAGVDAALIARYFGTKEGLYLAVLEDPERAGTVVLADTDLDGCLRLLLTRWSRRGTSPVASALVAPDLSPDVAAQLSRVLDLRVIKPLIAALDGAGAARNPRG